jgi:hypothetical protein
MWGVNMEQLQKDVGKFDTDQKFVNGDVSKYKQLLEVVFDILEQGAIALHDKTCSPVMMRVGYLGMGEWSNGLWDMGEFQNIKSFYHEELLNIHKRHHDWLQIRNPRFPDKKTYATIDQKWELVERNQDPFGDSHDRDGTTIVKRIPERYLTLIVNAWDDGSFIGNGGSRDDSMDGWTVAGGSSEHQATAFGPTGSTLGFNFVNASYLHNPVFSTRLTDPSTWSRYASTASKRREQTQEQERQEREVEARKLSAQEEYITVEKSFLKSIFELYYPEPGLPRSDYADVLGIRRRMSELRAIWSSTVVDSEDMLCRAVYNGSIIETLRSMFRLEIPDDNVKDPLLTPTFLLEGGELTITQSVRIKVWKGHYVKYALEELDGGFFFDDNVGQFETGKELAYLNEWYTTRFKFVLKESSDEATMDRYLKILVAVYFFNDKLFSADLAVRDFEVPDSSSAYLQMFTKLDGGFEQLDELNTTYIIPKDRLERGMVPDIPVEFETGQPSVVQMYIRKRAALLVKSKRAALLAKSISLFKDCDIPSVGVLTDLTDKLKMVDTDQQPDSVFGYMNTEDAVYAVVRANVLRDILLFTPERRVGFIDLVIELELEELEEVHEKRRAFLETYIVAQILESWDLNIGEAGMRRDMMRGIVLKPYVPMQKILPEAINTPMSPKSPDQRRLGHLEQARNRLFLQGLKGCSFCEMMSEDSSVNQWYNARARKILAGTDDRLVNRSVMMLYDVMRFNNETLEGYGEADCFHVYARQGGGLNDLVELWEKYVMGKEKLKRVLDKDPDAAVGTDVPGAVRLWFPEAKGYSVEDILQHDVVSARQVFDDRLIQLNVYQLGSRVQPEVFAYEDVAFAGVLMDRAIARRYAHVQEMEDIDLYREIQKNYHRLCKVLENLFTMERLRDMFNLPDIPNVPKPDTLLTRPYNPSTDMFESPSIPMQDFYKQDRTVSVTAGESRSQTVGEIPEATWTIIVDAVVTNAALALAKLDSDECPKWSTQFTDLQKWYVAQLRCILDSTNGEMLNTNLRKLAGLMEFNTVLELTDLVSDERKAAVSEYFKAFSTRGGLNVLYRTFVEPKNEVAKLDGAYLHMKTWVPSVVTEYFTIRSRQPTTRLTVQPARQEQEQQLKTLKNDQMFRLNYPEPGLPKPDYKAEWALRQSWKSGADIKSGVVESGSTSSATKLDRAFDNWSIIETLQSMFGLDEIVQDASLAPLSLLDTEEVTDEQFKEIAAIKAKSVVLVEEQLADYGHRISIFNKSDSVRAHENSLYNEWYQAMFIHVLYSFDGPGTEAEMSRYLKMVVDIYYFNDVLHYDDKIDYLGNEYEDRFTEYGEGGYISTLEELWTTFIKPKNEMEALLAQDPNAELLPGLPEEVGKYFESRAVVQPTMERLYSIPSVQELRKSTNELKSMIESSRKSDSAFALVNMEDMMYLVVKGNVARDILTSTPYRQLKQEDEVRKVLAAKNSQLEKIHDMRRGLFEKVSAAFIIAKLVGRDHDFDQSVLVKIAYVQYDYDSVKSLAEEFGLAERYSEDMVHLRTLLREGGVTVLWSNEGGMVHAWSQSLLKKIVRDGGTGLDRFLMMLDDVMTFNDHLEHDDEFFEIYGRPGSGLGDLRELWEKYVVAKEEWTKAIAKGPDVRIAEDVPGVVRLYLGSGVDHKKKLLSVDVQYTGSIFHERLKELESGVYVKNPVYTEIAFARLLFDRAVARSSTLGNVNLSDDDKFDALTTLYAQITTEYDATCNAVDNLQTVELLQRLVGHHKIEGQYKPGNLLRSPKWLRPDKVEWIASTRKYYITLARKTERYQPWWKESFPDSYKWYMALWTAILNVVDDKVLNRYVRRMIDLLEFNNVLLGTQEGRTSREGVAYFKQFTITETDSLTELDELWETYIGPKDEMLPIFLSDPDNEVIGVPYLVNAYLVARNRQLRELERQHPGIITAFINRPRLV